MTEQAERPLKELRFLLMLAHPQVASSFGYADLIFPLMLFENMERVPLLIPEPYCERLVQDWPEMLSRLENEAAIVDIPFHPEVERDTHGYIFNVMIAYLDSDTPALAEAVMLDKYKTRLWEQYRHLAHDFDFYEE